MTSDTGNLETETVGQENNLGVTIDSKLNFKQYIVSKVSVANNNLGMIFRTFTSSIGPPYIIFTNLSQEMFMNQRKTILCPHLEYACVIYGHPFIRKIKIHWKTYNVEPTWRIVPSLKRSAFIHISFFIVLSRGAEGGGRSGAGRGYSEFCLLYRLGLFF